ncbi:MAG TPA: helix-turn-helix domain-containing protein [Acidimicrobiales bacterium]
MGHRPRLTAGRSYGQREAVASALDLVGDRWTLLIVRELLFGPRRWTELLANLGGIGKNLLAQRLRELDEAGLVTSATLPWASSRTRLYALTDHAGDVERVVFALARAGAGGVPDAGDARPEWAVLAWAAARDDATARRDGTTHVCVDGEWFTVTRDRQGDRRARRGQTGRARTVVEATTDELFALAQRRTQR